MARNDIQNVRAERKRLARRGPTCPSSDAARAGPSITAQLR
ncbi:hypothetical protein [Nonomuraea sp. GTA35]